MSKISTCTCSAYKFPHRFGGGACTGLQIAVDYWESHYGSGECEECIHFCTSRFSAGCDVVDGIEAAKECPVVEDFCRDNDVKL